MNADDHDLTRRNWVLSITRAGIAIGVTGEIQAGTNAARVLPPGLYEPSTDHLGHALMSAGKFHLVPPGCPTDYIRPRAGSFEPLFFSADDFAIIQRLTQLLLDKDGEAQEVAAWIDLRVRSAADVREAALHIDRLHRGLAVAYFGSEHVIEMETSDPAKICREGLAWLEKAAESGQAAGFLMLTPQQQLALVDSISDERADKESQNPGTRLFALLKAETIRGFYTSQAGLEELGFRGNAFYARSPGCDSR